MRRVFSKAIGEETLSIRTTVEVVEALDKLAEEYGETRNKFIVLVLDEYLQKMAEEGNIPWPKDYVPKTKVTKRK